MRFPSVDLPAVVVRQLLRLHASSQSRPYFHLEGYMQRWWIFGDRSVDRNEDRPATATKWHGRKGGAVYELLTRLCAVRAHVIMRSDNDRCLHDHPCGSISVVLDGGYWEVLPCAGPPEARQELLDEVMAARGCKPSADLVRRAARCAVYWRGSGAVVVRRAGGFHRLILPPGTRTSSIFALGPRRHSWGFLTDRGKVLARDYLKVDPMRPGEVTAAGRRQGAH